MQTQALNTWALFKLWGTDYKQQVQLVCLQPVVVDG